MRVARPRNKHTLRAELRVEPFLSVRPHPVREFAGLLLPRLHSCCSGAICFVAAMWCVYWDPCGLACFIVVRVVIVLFSLLLALLVQYLRVLSCRCCACEACGLLHAAGGT